MLHYYRNQVLIDCIDHWSFDVLKRHQMGVHILLDEYGLASRFGDGYIPGASDCQLCVVYYKKTNSVYIHNCSGCSWYQYTGGKTCTARHQEFDDWERNPCTESAEAVLCKLFEIGTGYRTDEDSWFYYSYDDDMDFINEYYIIKARNLEGFKTPYSGVIPWSSNYTS